MTKNYRKNINVKLSASAPQQVQKYAKDHENQRYLAKYLAFLKHIQELRPYKKGPGDDAITKQRDCFSPNNRKNEQRKPPH